MSDRTAGTAHDGAAGDASVIDLMAAVVRDARILVQRHVALLRAELSEKTGNLLRSAVTVAAGAIIAVLAAVFILLAVSLGISAGLAAAGTGATLAGILGPLIVGILTLAAAAHLVTRGVRAFARESLLPQRSLQALAEDRRWVAETLAFGGDGAAADEGKPS